MTEFLTDTLRLERDGGRVTITFDVVGRSVNVVTRQFLADLDAGLDRLAAAPRPDVLILRGKPSGFLAGADLREFSGVRTAADAVALSAEGQRVYQKLADFPSPTVAVIAGPCLGGGLELALACDYRIAIAGPKTQLGLPEVELGLLPGWGGTQRLPATVGLEQALRLILGGKRLDARSALKIGLVDDVIEAVGPVVDGFVSRVEGTGKRRGHGKRSWRRWFIDSTPVGRLLAFRGAMRVLRSRVPDDMPAPFAAFEAVRVGATVGGEAGFRAEREAIGRLALSPSSRNLINLFTRHEAARKSAAGSADQAPPRVGIIGAGTMGAAIAQLAALKGSAVVVREPTPAALDAGMRRIRQLFDHAVERRVLSRADADAKLAGITGTTEWTPFAGVDIVVEAVVEDLALKRDVFAELERVTPAAALLASNTSSLSIASLQDGQPKPGRIAGLHFFNPVHKMPLVEVARGPATDPATTSRLSAWAASLGKVPVLVKDSPGLLVNRILMPYLAEAVVLVSEDVPISWVDLAMKRFGMPVGPLELLDQVGIDVAAHIARAVKPVFGSRFPDSLDLDRMVERGWLGQKSGCGFYTYVGTAKEVNDEAEKTLAPPRAVKVRRADREAFLEVARRRMVLVMVNEAAGCIAEGLVDSAAPVDLALVLGTGWAPHRGGPLQYADDLGIGEVVRRLRELRDQFGTRFEPHPELVRRAEAGPPFHAADVPVPQPA